MTLACVAALTCTAADDPFGAAIYKKHCAACHDSPEPGTRVPSKAALRKMPAATILRALETGVMVQQSAALTRIEKRAVANFLGSVDAVIVDPAKIANRCAVSQWTPVSARGDWRGWSPGLDNWRHQPDPGLDAATAPRLALKWAFGFPGGTLVRSQPAVAAGRLFIGSHDGTVYSLDAKSGCVHWSTVVTSQVRTGLTIGRVGDRWVALAGDAAGQLHALDAATGTPLWKIRPDKHPAAMITSTPVLHGGRVYVGVSSYEEASALSPGYVCCTFRGSVVAVDGRTGQLIWKTYLIAAEPRPGKSNRGNKTAGPSGAGVWSAPTLDPDSGVLYVATGDNYSDPPTQTSDAAVALSMDSGEIRWIRQFTRADAFNSSCTHPTKYNCPDSDGPDYDLGASPMLVPLAKGRRALILAQKSGMVHAIDPDREGEILWQARAGEGGVLGGVQWGIATDGSKAYVAVSGISFARSYPDGAARPVRTLDHTKGGGLLAFRLHDGELLWRTPAPPCSPTPCSPAQSAAITSIPGAVFSGSVDGHIRAYSPAGGAILWDYETAREFQTVNGVPARGGSMDAGGPVAAGGMLFAGSGYGQWGGKPGNVLLAFEVKK
jgi:polyvinyl alcohol dehydrogenase (cytochrome)